jgi:3-hydroxy-9,10-secoandrosta-1,3,5(10)-triene-9,17-dione monooxygenase
MSDAVLARSSIRRPDAEEMAARAHALVPSLVERSAEAQATRMIPPATIADLNTLELTRLLQPKRFGGFEFDYSTFTKVTEALANGCASTAWVYSVFTEHMWVIASYPERTQIEVWGDNPGALASSSFVPRAVARHVKGGFELSGTWPFSSGCDYADWVILGAHIEEADGSRSIFNMLVPRSDIRIVDDWHVLGLAATGSKSVALDNVFVPTHRGLRHDHLLTGAVPGAEVHPHFLLVRAPRQSFAIYTLPPIMMALAQRAFDLVSSSLHLRISQGTRIAELEMAQVSLAKAGAEIDSVRLTLTSSCLQAEEDLRRGVLSAHKAVTTRRDVVYGMRRLRSAIESLCNLAGSSWVYNNDPLQSILRDALTASVHRSANWEGAAVPYGRMLLESTSPPR